MVGRSSGENGAMTEIDLEALLARVAEQYKTSDEAREGILTLIVRLVDEYQFGKRDLGVEDLAELAHAWAEVNDGLTGTEATIDWIVKERHRKDA